MMDNPRNDPTPRPAEPELSVRELADGAVRKVVTAIVIAAALVALAIYAQPAPPRYQAVVGDGQIVRIDTRSGTILSCVGNECSVVVRRGQSLVRRRALPKQDAQPARLPAPGPAPAPPAAAER